MFLFLVKISFRTIKIRGIASLVLCGEEIKYCRDLLEICNKIFFFRDRGGFSVQVMDSVESSRFDSDFSCVKYPLN